MRQITRAETIMTVTPNSTPCWIYRSSRTAEMYLYLAQEADFAAVPAPLLERFGQPALVMQLDLDADRALARENVDSVLRNLHQSGFHLQLPPQFKPQLYAGD
jgi:uncharacterized protein YcgL (UPF0745 family)